MSAKFAVSFPPAISSLPEMTTSISELRQAHAYMLKTGLFHQPFAVSRLLTTAASNSDTLLYADSIFTQTQHPTTFMYNTMIRAYATTSNPRLSFNIFLKLIYDVFPDKYTFTFILKACATLCSVQQGQQVHALVVKYGLGTDLFICNTLLHMYAKCRCFEIARDLHNRMPDKDVISWNAMLSVYTETGFLDLARALFAEMPVKNLESWNFMLSGYVNSGLVDEARRLFDGMLVKDVVSWNAMLTGYAKAGRQDQVFELFKEMQKEKVKPNNRTLVSLLSACASAGALSQGKWIHAYIDRNGIEVNGFLSTAIVDMYSKCGSIEKALEVFDSTSRKEISTWNAMITGLSLHGLGKHALKVFSEMVANGFKPNEVTFVSLLSACSRAGLLLEAREVFGDMVLKYGIERSIEHYGCMVDLLGRFGLLKEAAELAQEIPVKEVPSILESLLSSCRYHGNIDLAEQIAKKLLDLVPQESTGYVQLSNIHASSGRWNDVSEVRRKMREKQFSKEPGGSMIEIDGIVHEFLAGEGIIS